MVLWISFNAIYLPPFFSTALTDNEGIEVVVGILETEIPLAKVILTLTKLNVSIIRCLWHKDLRIE